MSNKATLMFAFKSGAYAGVVALAFSFFIRLGNVAPFAPETAIESFIGVVPAWIEEPLVDVLGDGALLLGLLVSTAIAIVVYGIFGVLFEKYYSPRINKLKRATWTEKFLSYSIFPWLFFGLVVFPLTGGSFFGLGATVYEPYEIFIFPITLLVAQLLFCYFLLYQYKNARMLSGMEKVQSVVVASAQTKDTPPVSKDRRAAIEKGVLFGLAAVLAITSLARIITSAAGSIGTSSTRAGSSYDLAEAPEVFDDPRLAPLVNSEITANPNFYRVAIDLFDPSVDPNTWKLQVEGTNEKKSYAMEDLQNLPSVTQYTTFECISNLVNGNLISNAKWSGVRISDLLSDTGISLADAQYVVFTSIDGYTVGLPISIALMDDALLAYQMNDAPLPQNHGYPLRAVIPGQYGQMSAKWITKISVIDSSYSGYWQTRGWTENAEVNTLAFIEIPGDGSQESLSQYDGSVLLGGYAFAGDRGISKVEISVDGGNTWQPAILKEPISNLTWRLWAFEWNPLQQGAYQIYARATDGDGNLQTSIQASPYPGGATGYAMISINVGS